MSSSASEASTLPRTNEGKRICQIVKVRPERLAEYKACHAAVWPGVLATLRKSQIVDYSIYYFEPLHLLIAHMRYIGPEEEFASRMDKVKEDEATRKWWKLTDGMQESFIPGATGSESGPGWWAPAEEVFRFEQ